MPNTLDFDLGGTVPPWGRNATEYEAFFALSDVAVSARVLDCGSGPASFAAEWSGLGHFVVAVDPVYQRAGEEIAAEFEPTAQRMLEGTRKAYDRLIWTHYKSPEDVVERRRETLQGFLADYQSPYRVGRYVAARLTDLPSSSGAFDLVLCAHLLFLYSNEFSLDLHVASLREMLRVGREVRVFPLLDMQGERSKHLDAIVREFETTARVEIVEVPFEFRRGDRFMLRAQKA